MATTTTEPVAYWSMTGDALAAALDTDGNGLTPEEAAARLARYGANSLQARQKVTPLGLFLNQFKSAIILILLFATVVSAILRDWADAVIILAIVLGSALLSFLQEYSASNAAAKLQGQLTVKASVIRGGQTFCVAAADVVPGDIVLLSAGSLIPADGLVLEAHDFFVSQAVLTGETFPVEKQPGVAAAASALSSRNNCVFMGTNGRTGSARVLVAATGNLSAFGKVAERLSLRAPETEFERGIRRLGYLLSEVTLVLVLAVFATNVFFQKPVLDSLLFSLALAVGLTPQLLPAIININLARGSQTMAASGVIVRRLASLENFGSMDVLCTDKTGTLTEGVVRLDGAMDVLGRPSDLVFHAAYLNAYFETGLSNPLDEAVLAFQTIDTTKMTKIDEIPYDFVRKRLSVVVDEPEADGSSGLSRQLITKGALNNVLDVSSQVRAPVGVVPLDDAQTGQINALYTDWSGQGFRVLGVATRPIASSQAGYTRADERDLIFEGFLLFFDPPKTGVQATVNGLEGLGVRLKIITGDNKLVALHTAQAIGLPVSGVLTGSEMSDMRDEALWQRADQVNLFAEVDPNQKERIILALQKMGHVVGYMGDGINDAPALHAADVGISVDSAVDVAKEAADFVLLKQDLAVLQGGIVQGRRTFANTLKYVFMATSANFGNMFSVAGASFFLSYLPMLPKQILLINFLTDLPEMTIAGDTVDDDFIRQPHRWDIGFIRRFMLIFGPLSSVFDYLTFAVLLWVLQANQAQFHTGWFIESVISATLVVFALRTRLPLGRSRPSRPMILVTLGVAVIALLLPYTPLAAVLGFEPLPVVFLATIMLIVVIYFAAAETTKRWFYRHVVAI